MEKNIKYLDRAYELLSQSIEEINQDDTVIAEYTKKVVEAEDKKNQDIRKARQYAATYFTKEKISELHQRTLDLLKCDDFNEEEYINAFSDSSNIDINRVLFLFGRQRELDLFEKDFDINDKSNSSSAVETILARIAEALMKGGAGVD